VMNIWKKVSIDYDRRSVTLGPTLAVVIVIMVFNWLLVKG